MMRELAEFSKFYRRSAAFSLVELLVVVAVIIILTAILFPVFAQVHEKGRASACLSNYHQIGLAIQLYAQDDDGITPPNGGSFSGIIADCAPYSSNTGAIFICPDDYDRTVERRAGSYRMPSDYQGLSIYCDWPDPYNNGKPANTALTTLAYEAEQDYSVAPIVPTYRHSGGTQFLLFDGHTKWMKGVSKDTDD